MNPRRSFYRKIIYVAAIAALLAAGADRNVKSNQGYTPLDVAKFPDFAPNQDVIKALEEPAAPSDRENAW